MPVWRKQYPGVENLKVAVMGCIVNGPGESKHADIGISLPGTGEAPAAPVFIDGEKAPDFARRGHMRKSSRPWLKTTLRTVLVLKLLRKHERVAERKHPQNVSDKNWWASKA